MFNSTQRVRTPIVSRKKHPGIQLARTQLFSKLREVAQARFELSRWSSVVFEVAVIGSLYLNGLRGYVLLEVASSRVSKTKVRFSSILARTFSGEI